MINTSALASCVTASRFKAAYDKYLDDAADIYGRGTREYEAFKMLLDKDASNAVETQVRHLSEVAARYTRECGEWLALLKTTPGIPHA